MSKKKPLSIGGQAIIEGVMMRSPHFYTLAVRRSTGKIVSEVREYVSLVKRSRFWAVPLIRGMVVLYESLLLGTKALMFSNTIAMEDIEQETQKDKGKPKKAKDSTGDGFFIRLLKALGMVLYFIFVFAFALFLFKFLPLWVANFASGQFDVVAQQYWLFNLIDGVMKVVIFLTYILLISLLPDIRRVFGYHGAEHQAIWAYEKGKPLTIKHAQEEHPEHPRCGTSFIILVLLLSVAVYTVLPSSADFWPKLAQRIAVLPLLAGLSYEVLKFSAKYEQHWWMHWITLPGIWLQHITTKKPDDEMEEVAIVALKAAIEAEKTYLGK